MQTPECMSLQTTLECASGSGIDSLADRRGGRVEERSPY